MSTIDYDEATKMLGIKGLLKSVVRKIKRKKSSLSPNFKKSKKAMFSRQTSKNGGTFMQDNPLLLSKPEKPINKSDRKSRYSYFFMKRTKLEEPSKPDNSYSNLSNYSKLRKKTSILPRQSLVHLYDENKPFNVIVSSKSYSKSSKVTDSIPKMIHPNNQLKLKLSSSKSLQTETNKQTNHIVNSSRRRSSGNILPYNSNGNANTLGSYGFASSTPRFGHYENMPITTRTTSTKSNSNSHTYDSHRQYNSSKSQPNDQNQYKTLSSKNRNRKKHKLKPSSSKLRKEKSSIINKNENSSQRKIKKKHKQRLSVISDNSLINHINTSVQSPRNINSNTNDIIKKSQHQNSLHLLILSKNEKTENDNDDVSQLTTNFNNNVHPSATITNTKVYTITNPQKQDTGGQNVNELFSPIPLVNSKHFNQDINSDYFKIPITTTIPTSTTNTDSNTIIINDYKYLEWCIQSEMTELNHEINSFENMIKSLESKDNIVSYTLSQTSEIQFNRQESMSNILPKVQENHQENFSNKSCVSETEISINNSNKYIDNKVQSTSYVDIKKVTDDNDNNQIEKDDKKFQNDGNEESKSIHTSPASAVAIREELSYGYIAPLPTSSSSSSLSSFSGTFKNVLKRHNNQKRNKSVINSVERNNLVNDMNNEPTIDSTVISTNTTFHQTSSFTSSINTIKNDSSDNNINTANSSTDTPIITKERKSMPILPSYNQLQKLFHQTSNDVLINDNTTTTTTTNNNNNNNNSDTTQNNNINEIVHTSVQLSTSEDELNISSDKPIHPRYKANSLNILRTTTSSSSSPSSPPSTTHSPPSSPSFFTKLASKMTSITQKITKTEKSKSQHTSPTEDTSTPSHSHSHSNSHSHTHSPFQLDQSSPLPTIMHQTLPPNVNNTTTTLSAFASSVQCMKLSPAVTPKTSLYATNKSSKKTSPLEDKLDMLLDKEIETLLTPKSTISNNSANKESNKTSKVSPHDNNHNTNNSISLDDNDKEETMIKSLYHQSLQSSPLTKLPLQLHVQFKSEIFEESVSNRHNNNNSIITSEDMEPISSLVNKPVCETVINSLAPYQIGDKVDGLYILSNGSKRWFPGTIKSIESNVEGVYTATLLYNDGDIQTNKPMNEIKLSGTRSTNTTAVISANTTVASSVHSIASTNKDDPIETLDMSHKNGIDIETTFDESVISDNHLRRGNPIILTFFDSNDNTDDQENEKLFQNGDGLTLDELFASLKHRRSPRTHASAKSTSKSSKHVTVDNPSSKSTSKHVTIDNPSSKSTSRHVVIDNPNSKSTSRHVVIDNGSNKSTSRQYTHNNVGDINFGYIPQQSNSSKSTARAGASSESIKLTSRQVSTYDIGKISNGYTNEQNSERSNHINSNSSRQRFSEDLQTSANGKVKNTLSSSSSSSSINESSKVPSLKPSISPLRRLVDRHCTEIDKRVDSYKAKRNKIKKINHDDENKDIDENITFNSNNTKESMKSKTYNNIDKKDLKYEKSTTNTSSTITSYTSNSKPIDIVKQNIKISSDSKENSLNGVHGGNLYDDKNITISSKLNNRVENNKEVITETINEKLSRATIERLILAGLKHSDQTSLDSTNCHQNSNSNKFHNDNDNNNDDNIHRNVNGSSNEYNKNDQYYQNDDEKDANSYTGTNSSYTGDSDDSDSSEYNSSEDDLIISVSSQSTNTLNRSTSTIQSNISKLRPSLSLSLSALPSLPSPSHSLYQSHVPSPINTHYGTAPISPCKSVSSHTINKPLPSLNLLFTKNESTSSSIHTPLKQSIPSLTLSNNPSKLSNDTGIEAVNITHKNKTMNISKLHASVSMDSEKLDHNRNDHIDLTDRTITSELTDRSLPTLIIPSKTQSQSHTLPNSSRSAAPIVSPLPKNDIVHIAEVTARSSRSLKHSPNETKGNDVDVDEKGVNNKSPNTIMLLPYSSKSLVRSPHVVTARSSRTCSSARATTASINNQDDDIKNNNLKNDEAFDTNIMELSTKSDNNTNNRMNSSKSKKVKKNKNSDITASTTIINKQQINDGSQKHSHSNSHRIVILNPYVSTSKR